MACCFCCCFAALFLITRCSATCSQQQQHVAAREAGPRSGSLVKLQSIDVASYMLCMGMHLLLMLLLMLLLLLLHVQFCLPAGLQSQSPPRRHQPPALTATYS
jgi:hypothetical protein